MHCLNKLAILLWMALPLWGQTRALPFGVDYAYYSAVADRIVTGSYSERAIHLYDPVSGDDAKVEIPGPYLNVSVSPDGQYAVVKSTQLHWVDLATRKIIGSVNIGTPSLGVIAVGRFAYTQTTSGVWWVASLDAGTHTGTGIKVFTDTFTFASNASGTALYSWNSRISIGADGRLRDLVSRTVFGCEKPLAVQASRIVFDCGYMMEVGPVASQDLQYRGDFDSYLDGAAISESRQEIALLRKLSSSWRPFNVTDKSLVMLYSFPWKQYRGTIVLPDKSAGYYAFYSKDSSRLTILSYKAGWFSHTYDLSRPCTNGTVGSTSETARAAGGPGQTTASIPEGCVWNAVSNAPWIEVLDGAVGGPSGSVTWYTQPNTSSQPRSGTLTIAGRSVTITQEGQSALPDNPVVLPYPVRKEEIEPFSHSFAMSRTRNLVLAISRRPDQLHGYDPATLRETFRVHLPAEPNAMSVSADGNYAAVGFDGLIARVDLSSGAIDRFCAVPERVKWVVLTASKFITPTLTCDLNTGLHKPTVVNGETPLLSVDGKYLFTGLRPQRYRVDGAEPILVRESTDSYAHGYLHGVTADRLFTGGRGYVVNLSENPLIDLTRAGEAPNLTGQWILPLISRDLLISVTQGDQPRLVRATAATYTEQPSLPLPALTPLGVVSAPRNIGLFASADESVAVAAFQNPNYGPGGQIGPPVLYLYRLSPEALTKDTRPCIAHLSPSKFEAWQKGSTVEITVDIPPGCSWETSTSESWLQSKRFGVGPGTFTLSVFGNPGADRKGTLRVGETAFEVTQMGAASCVYALDQRSLRVPAEGAWYTFDVRTQPGCQINITGNSSLVIAVAGSENRIGIAANTGPERKFSIGVAGMVVEVAQDAKGTPSCTVMFDRRMNADGERGTITPTFSGTCPATWKIVGAPRWLHLFPLEGSTSGATTLSYTAYPNYSNHDRSGLVQFAGLPDSHVYQGSKTRTVDEQFVAHTYFSFFGRHPSDAEIAFQVNEGLKKGLARADLWMNFAGSEEFNGAGRFVAGLYVGLLARDAEFGGWLFQRNALATGAASASQLTSNFLGSPEWKLRFGSPSDREFVRLLYRNILLREPSTAELDSQEAALKSSNRVNMASAFLNTAEFRIGTGPRLTAFLLFATTLGRDPSAEELQNRITRLTGASAVRGLAEELLASKDFIFAVN